MKIPGIAALALMLAFCPAVFGAPPDIGLMARIHFNTQVRDFEASRAFYRMLGFTAGRGGFPATNTHEMARSLGMYDLCTYEFFNAEIVSIPDSRGPTGIDLIQFITPYNDAPPYALPNHLGMAYAALQTTDLASDVEFLKSQNVKFLAPGFGSPGNQFVFFQDLDGVLYKLSETTPPPPPSGEADTDLHITAMPYIALNVSDFERSYAFYQRLGYTETTALPQSGTLEEAQAYGLDRPFKIRGAQMALPRGDGHAIRIVQWLEPYDDDPAYPPPINHIGINRLALLVLDLDAAVKTLKAEGAEFLSDIAPCCSGTGLDETGIINLVDPDGIFVELVGPIAVRGPQPPPQWCTTE
jgi:catechol 2,3-dioxygenase-like lactoylglutathione lyase family enzyme